GVFHDPSARQCRVGPGSRSAARPLRPHRPRGDPLLRAALQLDHYAARRVLADPPGTGGGGAGPAPHGGGGGRGGHRGVAGSSNGPEPPQTPVSGRVSFPSAAASWSPASAAATERTCS